MTSFSGIWVPLVTPFKNGEVDYAAAQKLALHMVDSGVDGLVVCGTTGEATSLTHREKATLVKAVIEAVRGRCPVLMGIGGSNTYEVAHEALTFAHTGIEGFLMTAPYYVRPSQSGIIVHFRHVAMAARLPIVIYNIPTRTGVNIDPETIAKLCESGQFVAVKECGGLPQLMALTNHAPCNVLCGDDMLMLTTLVHGGHGAISASAHIHPELFVAMYRFAQQGNPDIARAIFDQLKPLIRVLFSEPNPVPVKAALAMQGWICDEVRLPMLPASAACKQQLRDTLDSLGTSLLLYHINGEKTHAA